MLNFDEDRYLRIQSGAVGLADRIHAEVVTRLGDGAENLFFVGVRRRRHPDGAGRPAAADAVDVPGAHGDAGRARRAGLGAPRAAFARGGPSLSGTTSESVEALP